MTILPFKPRRAAPVAPQSQAPKPAPTRPAPTDPRHHHFAHTNGRRWGR